MGTNAKQENKNGTLEKHANTNSLFGVFQKYLKKIDMAAVLKEGAKSALNGSMMLTGAALKSVKVAGVAANAAVELTGKGVEVTAKVASAAVNTTGVVGEAALQTASVATQAAAKVTQAAATATANASAATLAASANIVKSGVKATANIANAALTSAKNVSVQTLKSSADTASAAAKFSLGTVTTALKGLDNLRELGGMTGQAWVEKVKARKGANASLSSMRTPQIVLDILVKDFEKVAADLRSSFQDTILSSDVSLKLLVVTIKDLYCMSIYKRLTRKTCPKNSSVRINLEKKMNGHVKELKGRSDFFFKVFDQKRSQTLSLFKAESQKPPPPGKTEEQQVEQIKALFTKKLDEFSAFVAKQLTMITSLFETRTQQYQEIVDRAYRDEFSNKNVFNKAPTQTNTPATAEPNVTAMSAPAAGGRRKTRKHKHKKHSKKTRKH